MLAAFLARLATGGDEAGWAVGAGQLGLLDGRSWLSVDEAARRVTYTSTAPVGGVKGWLSADAAEPSGFVAAVTSWHVDGRFRERATRILGESGSALRATALTVRLFDHVPQVREVALAGLAEHLGAEHAEAALGVALAGSDRRLGAAALAAVTGILRTRELLQPVIRGLLASHDTKVRRWAYAMAHGEQMLTRELLLGAVHAEHDQFLRARCAKWLADVACPADLRALLEVRSVDTRLEAVTRIPDEDLLDEDLLALMVDRSPRVRAAARWRAERRGINAADWYRNRLKTAAPSPAVTAACLDGLASVAAAEDLELFVRYLSDRSPAVRAGAVEGAGKVGRPPQVVDELTPLLVDASPKVCSSAARVLSRTGGTAADAAIAWTSPQPWSRRAAWRLSRAGGSWDRVEADLRANCDADPDLSNNGMVGIRDWLATSAATTWAILGDGQRERIAALLERSDLADRVRDLIAFHAGISRPTTAPPESAGVSDAGPSGIPLLKPLLRLIKGGRPRAKKNRSNPPDR